MSEDVIAELKGARDVARTGSRNTTSTRAKYIRQGMVRAYDHALRLLLRIRQDEVTPSSISKATGVNRNENIGVDYGDDD